MKKIYIIRKYVLANSALEAIKLDKDKPVDDVWVHEDTHKEHLEQQIKNQIGFDTKGGDTVNKKKPKGGKKCCK